MLKGFKEFILRGNVVDLAVGVVIGASFNSVISAIVKDLITPLIGVLGGQPNFSSLSFTINHSKFQVGDMLNALISFLIISTVVYFFVVLPLNKLMATVRKEKPIEPDTIKCPFCFSVIPKQATKCAFCTSTIPQKEKKS